MAVASVTVTTYEDYDDGARFRVVDLLTTGGVMYSVGGDSDEYDTVMNSIAAYNDGVLGEDELLETFADADEEQPDPDDRGVVVNVDYPLGNGLPDDDYYGASSSDDYDDYE